jgi:formylglycine-generating enzyme required for sulfatase activity
MMKKKLISFAVAVITITIITACDIDDPTIPANPFLQKPPKEKDKPETPFVRPLEPVAVTLTVTVSNKTYDGTITATVAGITINGNLNGDDLTAFGTAVFEDADVGDDKTVTFSGWTLDGPAAEYYILSAQPDDTTANITVRPLTLSVSGNVVLTPLAGETSTIITVSGLPNMDTAAISATGLTAGITFNSSTNTITYNGTTAFANPSVTLNFSANAGSNYTGTASFTITVYDGQANYTGSGYDRRIPVRQSNIAAFNTYARTANGLTRHYKLTENVTLTPPAAGGSNWTAIGDFNNQFTGSFNGQLNDIAHLTINKTTEDNQGMFGCIETGGMVQSLGLVSGSISGKSYVGGVVGTNAAGTVQNCYVTSSITGSFKVGGVAGQNFSATIQRCYATGSVSGNTFVGGVVGNNQGTVQNCYATGSVTTTDGGSYYSGGVVGDNSGTVQNCYATGSVTSSFDNRLGGVAGFNGLTSGTRLVQNCVALNLRVASVGNVVRRVVAWNYSGGATLYNNYARSTGMTLTNNGVNYTPTSALNGEDGANTTAYNTQSFWTTASNWRNAAWNFTTVWQWNSVTNLPILRDVGGPQNHTVPMPDKTDPTVTLPTGLTAVYGQTLASISLPGNGSGSPAGAFTWTTPFASVGNPGLQAHLITFTPNNTAAYNTLTVYVNVRVLLGVEMVNIAGGTFTMGAPASENSVGSFDNERPQHRVTVSVFSIGKYEVTQEQYQAVMGINPSYFRTGADAGETQNRRPVECISWYDALVFCNRLSIAEGLTPAYSIGGNTNPDNWGGIPTSDNATWNAVTMAAGSNGYRLPTEAQWEYACRAGTTTPWHSGTQAALGNYAWYKSNTDKTHEVGKKQPNARGLYDMHGNVKEWCWDRYGAYSSGAQTNPTGAASESLRVRRGGDYFNEAMFARSAYRWDEQLNMDPSLRSTNLGLRLVRP